MWIKLLLAIVLVFFLVAAFVVEPAREHEPNQQGAAGGRAAIGSRLRLLTWNIGNGDLESESRAHADDLPAIAQVILDNDADAVALQELTGEDQLKLLLTDLKDRYRGFVSMRGNSDRVEAVLVKNQNNRPRRREDDVVFSNVPAGDRFAAAATFRLQKDMPVVMLVSAHADAFKAARRRTFVAEVTDWVRSQGQTNLSFIAGDLNFEVSTRTRNDLFTDDVKHDSESYAYLLKYFRDLGLDAGETSINNRRIDYILGPPTTAHLVRAEVLRGAAIGRMDHWPLLVEVSLSL
ncbi:MAG: endonuclease/exonuclease/phosphatase family protein [Acidobacteriota bacterium]